MNVSGNWVKPMISPMAAVSQDADDQRPRDLPHIEDHRDQQPDQSHPRPGAVGEHELHGDRAVTGGLTDQPGVDEPDEHDEEPDAHADRPLQGEGDGVHDRFTQAHDHQGKDDQAFEDDHPHGPGWGQPLAQDEPEGDRAVDAETGCHRNGIVGHHPHQDAEQAGDQGGARGHGRGIEARGRENGGVDEDDVGHHQERRDPGPYLGADG